MGFAWFKFSEPSVPGAIKNDDLENVVKIFFVVVCGRLATLYTIHVPNTQYETVSKLFFLTVALHDGNIAMGSTQTKMQ